MNIIAVIPARYQSSRFEGKPLAEICGKLMIERVYLQAKKVKEFSEVYVATDDSRIFDACQQRGINVIMTSTSHRTGTDRYVNIQGDEPLIEPETIKAAIQPYLDNPDTGIMVTNLMTEIHDPVDLINFTVPKVIAAADGRGVFLTRSAAPFPKGNINVKYYSDYGKKHGKAKVESVEDIEILRFIENGYHVHYIEVQSETIAVDTPNDLERVIEYMHANNIK